MEERFNDPSDNGFYAVEMAFQTADMDVVKNDIVGVLRDRKNPTRIRIFKTGPESGGRFDFMGAENMGKLKKLSPEEILDLTGGRPIPASAAESEEAFAAACRMISAPKF